MNWNETQYENPPAGSHVARCIKLIDLGTQPTTFNNQTKYQRKVWICWELPDTLMEGNYKPELKGKPFAISRRYTQSLASNAALKKALEGWRGKAFNKAELSTFEPKSILGKPCLLNLIENGDYVNVESITPLPKKMKCPKQVNSSVFFSLEPEEFSQEVLLTLPEKTQATIMASPEYQSLGGGQTDPTPDGDQQTPDEQEQDEPF